MVEVRIAIKRGDYPPNLSIGNPDGYFQIYWTWGRRAFCLSWRKGFETGAAPHSDE